MALAPAARVAPRPYQTFFALARLIISMVVIDWKRNTDLGSPSPFKGTVAPAIIDIVPESQVPGVKVKLPISGSRISVTSSRGAITAVYDSKMALKVFFPRRR